LPDDPPKPALPPLTKYCGTLELLRPVNLGELAEEPKTTTLLGTTELVFFFFIFID